MRQDERRLGTALPLLACLTLLVGALPYLPVQIDDAWITFAYAWNLADHGEIAWTSGERVEGFSSWSHLALMALGAFAKLDLSVVARVLSAACTALALAAVGRSRSGPERGVLLLALAAWQPLHFWSTQQLETMLAAALAAWAWPGVLAGGAAWGAACLGLAALAVTRPEGAAWLAVALAARLVERRPLGRPDLAAGVAVVGLAAFHAWRVTYFGEALPTPFLVKVEGVRGAADGWALAALQLGSAGVVLGCLAASRTAIPTLAWAPLGIQTLLLIRADGDWMGNARFLVPGVFAAVTAGLRHGVPVAPGFRRPALLALLPASFLWEPDPIGEASARLRDVGALVRVPTVPGGYPVADELRFVVTRVPEGGAVQIPDVGTPGHVPGVRVLDSTGLVDRAVAELHARPSASATAAVFARYAPSFGLACVRYLTPPGDADLGPLGDFPVAVPADRGWRWRCRDDTRVPPPVERARWAAMAARFPSQPWLREQLARAAVADGDEAAAFATGAPPDAFLLPETGAGHDAARGRPLVTDGEIVSAPLPPARWDTLSLVLDADDPGEEGALAAARWVGACEDRGVTVSVHTTATIALPPCAEPGPRRLAIRFLNDRFADGEDRNLWVRLRQAPPPR